MIKGTQLKVVEKGKLDYVEIELPKLRDRQALVKGVLSGVS